MGCFIVFDDNYLVLGCFTVFEIVCWYLEQSDCPPAGGAAFAPGPMAEAAVFMCGGLRLKVLVLE